MNKTSPPASMLPEIADASTGQSSPRPPIHVAALMEASTITGPAKNLLRFAEGAAAAGAVRLTILTFVRGARGTTNQFIDAARARGIRIEVIPEDFRFDPRIVARLRRLLTELKPDIFQTHGVKGHFLARFVRSGLPWVAFHHGYTAEDLKMKAFNRLNRWSLPRADLAITVCRPFAEEMTGAGVSPARIRVLPNSIEPRARLEPAGRQALRRRWNIADHERVILAVGRFSPEKGHADLVDAVAQLQVRRPDLPFRLLLVGDGGGRNRIEALIAARNLSGCAIFTGHQRDAWPYYSIADLFVLPSLSEGSPNALLEAMSAGLPIVATAVGGVPETVIDGVSALVTPRSDPAALSNAMELLLSDAALASEIAGNAQRESARFSPAAYMDSLVSIYSGLLRAAAGSIGRPY